MRAYSLPFFRPLSYSQDRQLTLCRARFHGSRVLRKSAAPSPTQHGAITNAKTSNVSFRYSVGKPRSLSSALRPAPRSGGASYWRAALYKPFWTQSSTEPTLLPFSLRDPYHQHHAAVSVNWSKSIRLRPRSTPRRATSPFS